MMIFTLFVAAFAAISTAQCQEVTETVTSCTTSYSEFAPSTAIRTAYYTSTFTYSFSITSTTQETITVTPVATTFTDVVNVTSTTITTITSVPAAVTVPASSGFFPLINRPNALGPAPTPAIIGRHRRGLIESRAQHLDRVKRLPKTPAGNTSGFIVLPNGSAQSLSRDFITDVVCNVAVNINSTQTTVVTATPVTELLVPATATAVSTSTFTVTETVLEVDAQPTEYAACQPNNVGKYHCHITFCHLSISNKSNTVCQSTTSWASRTSPSTSTASSSHPQRASPSPTLWFSTRHPPLTAASPVKTRRSALVPSTRLQSEPATCNSPMARLVPPYPRCQPLPCSHPSHCPRPTQACPTPLHPAPRTPRVTTRSCTCPPAPALHQPATRPWSPSRHPFPAPSKAR